MKKDMDQLAAELQKQLVALGKDRALNNQVDDMLRQANQGLSAEYRKEIAAWKANYPADPKPMIAMRLKEFLAESATVDYIPRPRRTGSRPSAPNGYAACCDLAWRTDMATQIADPKGPESKPHGTTTDQVKEMESEGQAQTHAESSPVESPSKDQMQGAPGPVATPDLDEAAPRGGDQDIDTAGTDADTERSATNNLTGQSKDSTAEVPGDTDSADIVGPTGEQMPRQSHDGLEADSRGANTHRDAAHH